MILDRINQNRKKYFWRTVRLFMLVYFGLGAVLYFNQRGSLYFPKLGNPEACVALQKMGVEKIRQGQTTLYYQSQGKKLMVFYHGNAGTACDRKFLADFFASQDMAFLFVEYAGYGDGQESTQVALEQNVRDADEFVRQKSFDELVIMGESLGTGLAAYHAKLRAPEKLVLVSPYTSIVDVAASHYPVYPVKMMLRDNYRIDWFEQEYSGKILVIHGLQDDIIPVSLGEKVWHDAPFAQKESFFVEGAGHNDLYETPGVLERISAFLLK